MNDQDDLVHIPGDDLPVEENRQEEFMAAMNRARFERAPLQVFQNLLNDAPPLSVEAMYDITEGFLSHANVVQLLLKHEPKIARHEDPNYGLLLHRAVTSFNVSDDTIELILDAYPEGISKQGRYGLLPLHLACETIDRRSVQTAELLLSRYPGAAGVSAGETCSGKFPLHLCLQHIEINRSDSFMLTLIKAYPDAASIKTRHNETPLHLACKSGFSLAIIQRLYQLYPEAVSVQSDDVRIPLHLACQSAESSVEVIKYLLKKSPPEGPLSRDRRGELPLHCAVQRQQAPLEVAQILIEAYPNAVNVADNSGKLPLHGACNTGASPEVIQLLLDCFVGDKQHHNGLSIADDCGISPIHWYVRSDDVRPETLQQFLQLYPEGVHAVDSYSMLPLHWACSSIPVRLEIIRILVEAAPYTVIQESAGGRTPIERARGVFVCARNTSVRVLEYLLEQQTEVVNAMKEAFVDVADTQLGLPDLVMANVWSFANPNLWTPGEEEWAALEKLPELGENV